MTRPKTADYANRHFERHLRRVEVADRPDLEAAVAELNDAYERHIGTLENRLDAATRYRTMAEDRANSLTKRMEEMEAAAKISIDEADTQVTIGASRQPFRPGRPAGWTVADLEEACMRLRIAGAGDQTVAEIANGKMVANVAEPLQPTDEEREGEARAAREARRKNRRHAAGTAGVWAAGIILGTPFLLGVWWVLTLAYGFMWGLVT